MIDSPMARPLRVPGRHRRALPRDLRELQLLLGRRVVPQRADPGPGAARHAAAEHGDAVLPVPPPGDRGAGRQSYHTPWKRWDAHWVQLHARTGPSPDKRARQWLAWLCELDRARYRPRNDHRRAAGGRRYHRDGHECAFEGWQKWRYSARADRSTTSVSIIGKQITKSPNHTNTCSTCVHEPAGRAIIFNGALWAGR